MGQTHPIDIGEQHPGAYLTLDASGCCTFCSAAMAGLIESSGETLIGKVPWNLFPESARNSLRHSLPIAIERQENITLETGWGNSGRWIECSIHPNGDSACITFLDVTKRRRSERLNEGHREVLTGIAAQYPLEENLERIVLLHEELHEGALCTVLLLDSSGEFMQLGAGPSLPDSYNEAVQGTPIGEGQGSCGTAIWSGKRVIVSDVATHPHWVKFRDLALKHGLKACWSTPILSSSGQCFGSFAVYYREIREPSEFELNSIDQMLTVTAIAIESARLVEKVRERDGFFELSLEVYCVYESRTGRVLQANPTYTRLTGFGEGELRSMYMGDLVHPDDLAVAGAALAKLKEPGDRALDVVCRIRCKDNSYRWLSWSSVLARDGIAFAVAQDITERKQAEVDLLHAASHDAVTHLPHRLYFERQLAKLLEGNPQPVWVLLVGLDRFQAVNEFMGHAIGDDVLRRIAERLGELLEVSETIARFAGDQFVIACSNLDAGSVLGLAERLRETVAVPVESDDYRLVLTASVGISRSPEHGQTTQELVSCAEAAMVRAKRRGRDGICLFTDEQLKGSEERVVLGRKLRGALDRGEMSLHYQPLLRASDRKLGGFEALLRWKCPECGEITPDLFIPIAETMGMMPEIGKWVIDEACRQARIWMDRGHEDFVIAVNVSAQELQRPNLTDVVFRALEHHGIPASLLGIEITESSLMENVDRVRATLAELKRMGVRLSLDDFGTGYSSLAYLKQFPIDTLKIDQRFVRGLPFSDEDAAIARTIVVMAHQLRMRVSAEGVENEEQAEFLRDIGCDELQGFYLGYPEPAVVAAAAFESKATKSTSSGTQSNTSTG